MGGVHHPRRAQREKNTIQETDFREARIYFSHIQSSVTPSPSRREQNNNGAASCVAYSRLQITRTGFLSALDALYLRSRFMAGLFPLFLYLLNFHGRQRRGKKVVPGETCLLLRRHAIQNFRDLYIYHKTSRSSNHMAYHWSVTVSRSIQDKEIVVVVKLWYIFAKNAESKFSQLKVLLILYKN